MAQKGFYFDMTSCTGCKCCQVACKDVNDLPVGRFYREARDYEGGKFPHMWAATVSMGCNHCDNPSCVERCPTGALSKDADTGLVIQDHDKCIGCRMCLMSCPYGAPSYDETEGRMGKCDGCSEKFLSHGLQPACVGACSTRALQFGDIDELRREHPDAVSDLNVLPSSSITKPNYLTTPKEDMR